MVPALLALARLLGRRLGGTGGGRAAVVVTAVLPWTMRFGSETRMYLLVSVLVMAGALLLLDVRAAPTRARVLGLGLVVAALLLTHYWSLFLLALVGLWHLPGALRRSRPELSVVGALLLGGALFLPWLPTLLFQAAHTGAPWATPPGVLDLLRTPTFWGGGPDASRYLLVAVLLPLIVFGALRSRAARALVVVGLGALLLAWTQTAVLGGAYTGRYTAVAVPLVAVAAGLGALALPGPRLPLVALGLLAAVGVSTGVPATGVSRSSAEQVARAVRAVAGPGAVVAYCPDQLAPPVQRLLGPSYEGLVYPTLGRPERVDWVDYAARQAAADPVEVAGRLDARTGSRPLLVLAARGYRTFGDQCQVMLEALEQRRGPATLHFGNAGTTGQLLYSFG
ncbi:MAG: hypothetical protein JWN08_329 [Frankiales bacterium]|nr:hypothetical protein [Frankiales bacterium]